MRPLAIALMLLTGTLLVVPVASADLCEVPGCQIMGAAVCIANDAMDIAANPKSARDTLRDCTTGQT